ncbi:hypothetical protein NESM_000011500 [Novymonas esmeraldas]|uniref:Uncharacterized protein n=1 Tax=Novymonas esmeraldas TaxID=1808958 RepID=A0AAW0F2L3_9TRYP
MPEAADVWLLGVVLTGESTFWLCEPTHLRPLPEDWKAINCRWLYPVEENLGDLADVSGFVSTDAVYEVDWLGTSKVLRPATLAWNVRGKRQKVGSTTYVFVPAEEIKQLDDAFRRFVKLEATAQPPPPPRVAPAVAVSPPASGAPPTTAAPSPPSAPLKAEGESAEADGDAPLASAASLQSLPTTSPSADAVARWASAVSEGGGSASRLDDGEDGEGSIVSSSAPRRRAAPRRGPTSLSMFPSHKRQEPHRGTTVYQAPLHSKPIGDHKSSEAFDWAEMYVLHRGSVDYLCPKETGNTYGFRLSRVMHDGFPVFLLFSSARNNSESIDSGARGVAVFEKALLSGEGGEGAVRSSVLVVTRLSSKKQQPQYGVPTTRTTTTATTSTSTTRPRHQRRRRRRGSDYDDSTSEEDEEDVSDDDSDDDDSEDEDDSETEEAEEGDERRGGRRVSRRGGAGAAAEASSVAAKIPKREAQDTAVGDSATAALSGRRRGRRKADGIAAEPLQAVSVNFWTDPQQAAPTPEQLTREFSFKAGRSEAPQTVVFSDGVCVTYTASTAAKYAPPEKKRKTAKHGGTATSSEDADLSMLNEHILNAFAQVKKDGA